MSRLRRSALDAGHGDALDKEALRHEEHRNHREIEEAGAQVPTHQWGDLGWTVDDFFNMCEAVTQRDANCHSNQ
ncbi:MAG: hypothetical protein OXC13_10080 [Caldilineaceae bacterium]|nr:hypothetical protein [Caldilineaceae bacterium]